MASTAASTPPSRGTVDGRLPCTSSPPGRATSVADGRRPTNEKRLQRSPLSTDSSRKPGSSPTRRRNAATGVMRSASTSRHTGTMACLAASSWNSALLGRSPLIPVVADARLIGLGGAGGGGGGAARRSARAGTEAAVEAREGAGVARALALLVHQEQEDVAVTVVVRLAEPLPVAGGVALGPPLLPRPAPVDHAPRLQRLAKGRLGHPAEHQHPPRLPVLGDGGHQPVGGEADLIEVGLQNVQRGDQGPGAHRYSPVPPSMRSDATAWMSRSRRMR